MSTFDDASLVFIPSGYKTSKAYSVKPSDGSGDLTFSRSNDTATRVGPDGLIEKVRTNLVLQSNTFSTTWTNTNTTETGGQAGYDGTNNAWLLESTSASGHIVQAISASGLQTYSVYAKAGTLNWIRILITASTGNEDRYFNLASGTIGGTTYGPLNSTITSEGNGWYRCSIVYNESTTGVRVYPASADLDTSGLGNILIQNAQLEAGDIATQPILTTSAAVSVGPVANVPRLDYLGSSCPRLLLEPQRTNTITFSEQINNAAFIGTTPVTANAGISPDGNNNADAVNESATTAFHIKGQLQSFTSGTAYTFSFFAKDNGRGFARVLFGNAPFTTNESAYYNLTTGATSSSANCTASMVNYGNGWWRCVVTATANATASDAIYFGPARNMTDGYNTYAGNASLGIFCYGIQQEAAAYATSYIPTLGAAVTRGMDVCYKTGISSLIGQTEGTIFLEIERKDGGDGEPVWLSDGTYNNYIYVVTGNTTTRFIGVTGGIQWNITVGALSKGVHKIAGAYKQNDIVLYVDGVNVGEDTTANIPTCSLLGLGYENGTVYNNSDPYNQVLLFTSRLSNADLAALTA